MKEAREARTQNQVWEVINRKRRRRVELNAEIGMEEWGEYFREVLGGSENRVKLELRRRERVEMGRVGREEEEEGINWEEIEEVMKKMKKGKAAGEDGIRNEVWLEEWLIMLVVKKREAVKLGEHR